MKLTKELKIILIYIPLITVGSFVLSVISLFLNSEKFSQLFIKITTLGIIIIPIILFFYIIFVVCKKIHNKLPDSQKENISYFARSFKITEDNKQAVQSGQFEKKMSRKISKEKIVLNVFTIINVLLITPSLIVATFAAVGLGGNQNLSLADKIIYYLEFFFPVIVVLSIIISRSSYISRAKNNSNNFKFPILVVISPTVIIVSFLFVTYLMIFLISEFLGVPIPR